MPLETFCIPPPPGARQNSPSQSSRGTHGYENPSPALNAAHLAQQVVINDIVDAEFKLVVAAIEIIADFLNALGLSAVPKFSLSQISKRFEGPILSPDDVVDAVERVATCERLGGGVETFAFATKLALNDALCPTLRYLYPTTVGPVVNVLNFLTFDPDPNKPGSCGCDDERFPCENDGLCLIANSGYIFLEVSNS